MIGLSVGSQHGNARMPPKELGKTLRGRFGLKRLPDPYSTSVMVLSQAVSVGLAFVEKNLHLEGFNGAEVGIDGNRCDLNDGMTLRLQAGGFEVKKDKLRDN